MRKGGTLAAPFRYPLSLHVVNGFVLQIGLELALLSQLTVLIYGLWLLDGAALA